MAKGDQGFASMNPEEQRDIASKGGRSQGKENNPGNFANDPAKASHAGEKGGSNSNKSNDEDMEMSEADAPVAPHDDMEDDTF